MRPVRVEPLKTTILTVDDGAANRRLLRAILEAEAYAVLEAADGIEAMAMLERQPVDAIISDVLMPNMDGFRLCLEVRKHPRFSALPFIVYTSTYNSASDRKLALDAGADDYVVKPAPAATILEALARARRQAGTRPPGSVRAGDEVDIIKQYNAALVTKLEERNEELSRKNEALQASEERFRQLAESIREVFWLTNPEKNEMLYVSPAYELIWGRPVELLLRSPRTWLDAIHDEDRARVEQAALRQQVQGQYDIEYRIVRPDGAIRWIRDQAFPVRNAAGEVYRLAGVAEDITNRKQLEEQYRHAQKMEAIGQLAGGVAHDFNNLLSVILMQVGIMKADDPPPGWEDGLREVTDAATRAANLTRQLLLFSRRQAVELKRLNLREVAAGVLRLVRRIIGENISVTLEEAAGPHWVSGDAGMLEQVIMNLVVNARDAMPHGGSVSLIVDETEWNENDESQPKERRGRFVRLSVTDTGTGIPPEVLPRIFEPFFTTKEAGHGTGLGLATVFSIVQEHHGWIEVRSVLGRGTTFAVHLPREYSGNGKAPDETMPPDHIRGDETLLLVEDDGPLRQTIAIVLRNCGYEVLEAPNATVALKLWERRRSDIRLALMDLILSGAVAGRELARRLQREEPALEVIFCSGYLDRSLAESGPPHAGEVFLPKPFEVETLVRLVRRRLDRRRTPHDKS